MSYFYLFSAILLEIAGTTCLKLSQGFTRLVPSILIFIFYFSSLAMLTIALKRIDVSVAYAVWSGLGTAVIAFIGIVWFGESLSLLKIVSLLLIIVGVVTLNLSGGVH